MVLYDEVSDMLWKTTTAALSIFGTMSTAGAWNTATTGITVDNGHFALNGKSMSYRFHIDEAKDVILDHHGGPSSETIPTPFAPINGWVGPLGRNRREYPDSGRGDFREPAIHIKHTDGSTVSQFEYVSHNVSAGKPGLPGLPATFGGDGDVSTVVVSLYDRYSDVGLDLSYSIFGEFDAVVRSASVSNKGKGNVTLLKAMSWSEDFPVGDWDMLDLHGDWAREGHKQRRRVGWGLQGAQSSTGYSSHLHNPFLALLEPSATEHTGEVYGYSLIYTGSHALTVEKASQGYTRAQLGINPIHLDWTLAPGETFTTPECVSVYSSEGIGGMSRKFHSLIRKHLIKSQYAVEPRPALLNSWEGLAFDYNESRIMTLAQESADLGVKLFVLDDGWFGDAYPRNDDTAGLGDWVANPAKFPNGIPSLVDQVTDLSIADSSEKLKFGLWFEPEMVNPNSTLYHEHPDWVLHSGDYPRTEQRNQLVLNLALPEVQQFCIDAVSNILSNASISYVKWDNNRGMHELPAPSTMHAYMLGMYHVFDTLTSRFPDVLWEGCASGGGRFDGGVLQYFPQIWTSDDTDGLERLYIQFGTSLVYPPSAMGGHVSEVPNQQTGRTTPLSFRAHVAMMTGSFGFELDPAKLEQDEKDAIPGFIALAEKVNPIVVQGDMWRLQLPEESNNPAALFISPDGEQAILFYFQIRGLFNAAWPRVRMRGLDAERMYDVEGMGTFSGAALMSQGIAVDFSGDYDSRVIFISTV